MTETITWHPYPQEKPPKAGYYLITSKVKEVEIDAWSGDYWNYFPSSFVIAWAELPKAYEG